MNNLTTMAYSTEEARIQLLDDIAHAIDELGVALAALGAAYELLDERTADQLEAELFRPVQVAYGRRSAPTPASPSATGCRGGRSSRRSPGASLRARGASSTPPPRRSRRRSTC